MSQVADVTTPAPLTHLQEEEQLFQDSVRRFAKERLGPYVRAMDEEGKFRKDLLKEMFELVLMSIDIKEQYGGQGGSFFQSVLAIEELAKVDPSASVIVDVQNTLVSNAIERWATAAQKQKYLSRLATESVGQAHAAMELARARQQQLTKPAGSLGRLEDIAVQIAGITGQSIPRIQHKAVIIMAGDHGVTSERVSAA